ncbi:uncharacterized protein LOC121726675 [Aricia agestis]|uniref:uncharacterized protein LOC121726675 n=1 Tax=Aricia agestis TaxID=91739 RepID=UPI001C2022AB|nr:uncharacterized protein LOC121726675 [Aricia agestis]
MEEDTLMEHSFLSNDQKNLKEFILLLETLPEVWDASNADRHNRAKREKAYKKLLEIYKRIKPEATNRDVNAKVNSLKSNYRKEYKKVILKQQSTGVDDADIPKSWVFHMLRFLDKSIKPIDMNSIDSKLDEFKIKEQSQSSFSSMDEPAPPPKKLKKNRPVAGRNDLLEKACHRPESPSVVNIDPAALYWTQKLYKLNPTQRVFAEKAINDVLLEAELGTLTRDSVQINVGRPEFMFVASPTNSE